MVTSIYRSRTQRFLPRMSNAQFSGNVRLSAQPKWSYSIRSRLFKQRPMQPVSAYLERLSKSSRSESARKSVRNLKNDGDAQEIVAGAARKSSWNGPLGSRSRKEASGQVCRTTSRLSEGRPGSCEVISSLPIAASAPDGLWFRAGEWRLCWRRRRGRCSTGCFQSAGRAWRWGNC